MSEAGMKVVDAAPPRQRRARSASVARVTSLSQLPPLGTSAELDSENKYLYNNYTRRDRLPDRDRRTQLIQHIQRQKVNAIVAHRFDEAQNYQTLLVSLQDSISEQDVRQRNRARLEDLDGKLQETNQKILGIKKETKHRLKTEVQEQAERRQQLVLKHGEELDDFEDHWNNPEFLMKFAKPSGRLLEMKRQERSMILTKLFGQAEVLKKKVHDLEKDESQVAQNRAVYEMDKARSKMLEKHHLELRNFEQHCARQLEIIRQEQDLKMKPLLARQTKLMAEIDEWKMNPPTALPPMASALPELRHQSVMTPRTAQRYSAFKAVSKQPRVVVRPLGNVKPGRMRSRRDEDEGETNDSQNICKLGQFSPWASAPTGIVLRSTLHM
jgi:hypothetical protein